jgi:acetyl-CoA acetyltransferase
MTGKLSLAAVAVAFAMLAMPGTASAHFHKHSWSKMDCALFGWMDHRRCHKAVKHKHRHKHAHK